LISSSLPGFSPSPTHPGARTGQIVAEFDAAYATQEKILYAAVH